MRQARDANVCPVVSNFGKLPAVHEAWLPREHSLHRPRHSRHQIAALLCAVLFFVTPTALWAIGLRPSEIENRPLAAFPGPEQGWEMATELPGWATDQLIFRSEAIGAVDAISRTVFGEPAPFGSAPDRGPLPGVPAEGGTPGAEVPPSQAGYSRVIEGKDGWLYLGSDVSGKCHPQQLVGRSVEKLLKLRDAVESSGRTFLLVIAPDKTTMVPQYLPDSYAGKDCAAEATERLWPPLTGGAGAIDLRETLAETASRIGEPVYFPQDSHWKHEGSIALARLLTEKLAPGRTATWDVVPDGIHYGPADLPPMLGKRATAVSTNYQLRPDGVTNRTSKQPRSLRKPVRMTSEPLDGTINDRTLVFGDSFAAASANYLGAAFTDLTLLGYATWQADRDATLREFVAAEVVVVEIVERVVASGTVGFLSDDFIDTLRPRLAARPLR